ncbi:MAG: ABC transporter permease [Termitinemataceae bacterium]|nr:MAG: ABC transporter permease [Termitinemataceae bacterium]
MNTIKMNTIKRLLKKRETILALIILVLVAIISPRAPSFLSYDNITNILKAHTVLGIFSIGVLLVIISGGIDVSFTAIAQVVQYAVVYVLINYMTGNIVIAMIMAIILGTAMGFLNGFLIYHYKMPAIIITIATQSLFYGLMYVLTHGRFLYEVPPYFWELSNAKVFSAGNGSIGLSVVTLIWFFMAVLFAFILKFTVVGRSVYLIGCNPAAAERVGVNILKTTLFVYGVTGSIAAIASIVHVSIVQTVIPSSIVGQEMQVIAAVVLGGASITGGRGSVLGTFLGVLLFSMLSNALTLLKIPSYWYNVFIGGIIIVSVIINAVQEFRQRKNIVRVNVAD